MTVKVSILALFLVCAHAKSIFEKREAQDSEVDFIRIGERTVSENRLRRNIDSGDRGVQNVYFVSRTPSVWGTAWLTCRQAMNGQLLTIENQAEDLFIRDLLIENQIASVWTSGAFDGDLGLWRWVSTGGELSYANWLTNEPTSNDVSARVAIKNSLFSHGWHTVDEANLGHYICEVRSDPVAPPTPAPTEVPPPPPEGA